ncbi:PPE family protein [Mycobacterium persicum]|uniref:PPE family protein n=1 Tax=Mycobacterium persicum TaxID=1487726 RepID=UPI000C07AF01|nr:PPE family protein [Mycobacterium persicum]
MVPEFAGLPPEINSARIFAGAGSGPLHMAAAAWNTLAAELAASAASFDSVVTGLTCGPWAGPAAVAMAAAATRYVGWLNEAAAQGERAASTARAAATAFETAMSATVHPAAVTANRMLLGALVATNFLGQNTPAIAATEFDYMEMWAQDVAAMVGYHAGATSAAAALTSFSVPPLDLAGLASQVGAGIAGMAAAAQHAVATAPSLLSGVQSLTSVVPVSSLTSLAQMAMYPASMLISPLMSLAQSANPSTAGLARAAAGAGADVPKFVGGTAPALQPLGGGAGMAAQLGKSHLLGAMSVPPAWQGSMPKGMASAAVAGLGAMASPAATAPAATPAGGGMPMMPMPMGMGGAGAGMPAAMMGRGGANPHVVQARPSVIPRTGVG